MVNNNIKIENARIIFKNFSGKEVPPYNPAGCRNFCVIIDNDLAVKLEEDGWNIKYLKPEDEEDEPQAYISVAVSFFPYPPKIVVISDGKPEEYTEEMIYSLDGSEMENVDLVIRPYNWKMKGKGGVKAYLKTMYVTLSEDEFAKKYAHYRNNDGVTE